MQPATPPLLTAVPGSSAVTWRRGCCPRQRNWARSPPAGVPEGPLWALAVAPDATPTQPGLGGLRLKGGSRGAEDGNVTELRWLRSAHVWVLAHTAHRGWVAAGLAFFIAVDVANAARTDWTSLALGVGIAVGLALRLWTLGATRAG